MKRYFVAGLLTLALVFAVAPQARAVTIEELQAQIAALMVQLQNIQAQTNSHVANIIASLSPFSPVTRPVSVSPTSITQNVNLGIFRLRSTNSISRINSLSFNLASGDVGVTNILGKLRLSNGTQSYGASSFSSSGILTFNNLNIYLSKDTNVYLTLTADIYPQNSNVSVWPVLDVSTINATDVNYYDHDQATIGTANDISANPVNLVTNGQTTQAPTINSVVPNQITPGDSVSLNGSNLLGTLFVYVYNASGVSVGQIASASGINVSSTNLTFVLPTNLISNPINGTYKFRVVTPAGMSNYSTFTLVPNTETGAGNNSDNALAVGARVRVALGDVDYSWVNVRETASLSGRDLGHVNSNSQGSIIAGPISSDGHTWWQVNFDYAVDGWVSGQFLARIVTTGGSPGTTQALVNLVTNGDFSSGLNNWVAQGIAQQAVGSSNGTLVITNDGSNSPNYYLRRQNVTVKPGVTYQFGGKITATLGPKATNALANFCQIDLYRYGSFDTNDITLDQSGTQIFTRTKTIPGTLGSAPVTAQLRLLTGYALNGTCAYDDIFVREVPTTVSEVDELNQMASVLTSLKALIDALR